MGQVVNGLARLTGMVVCLHAALQVQLFARVVNQYMPMTMDGLIMRCCIISSCQSAATAEVARCFCLGV